MECFTIDDRKFFLAKQLGKQKVTLLNWIRYQDQTGDASFLYDDHVKLAYKRDQSLYPFAITSNRGHMMISFEAYEEWRMKSIPEVEEEKKDDIDPEEIRLERYIRTIVDEKTLDKIQHLINERRHEIAPTKTSIIVGRGASSKDKENRKKNLKRITPQLVRYDNLWQVDE